MKIDVVNWEEPKTCTPPSDQQRTTPLAAKSPVKFTVEVYENMTVLLI